MTRIKLAYSDANGISGTVAFEGTWLLREVREDAPGRDIGTRYSVALTASGQYLVFMETPEHGSGYTVYHSFQEMIDKHAVPPGIACTLNEQMGYVEFYPQQV